MARNTFGKYMRVVSLYISNDIVSNRYSVRKQISTRQGSPEPTSQRNLASGVHDVKFCDKVDAFPLFFS